MSDFLEFLAISVGLVVALAAADLVGRAIARRTVACQLIAAGLSKESAEEMVKRTT